MKIWRWKTTKKRKWLEKITNGEILERIREKKSLINNKFRTNVNWIARILRRNHLLNDAIEGQDASERIVRKTQY